MTFRRLFWRCATPFVHLAHRFGWCSYEWVNVCHGAWRPDRFTRLWQHERYGMHLIAMPDELALCGIPHRVAVSEGTVVFVCECGMCVNRLTFHRDDHDRFADLWYVELQGHVPASHVDMAYRWIRAVFGGSFVHKRSTTPSEARA